MNDIKSKNLSNSSLSELRKKNKNGLIVSCIVFFKSTVGISLLSNQAFYFGTGYLLAPVLAILIIFLIGYNMTLMVNLSKSIEDSNYGVEIDNYEETALYVFKKPKIVTLFYISNFL